MVCVQFFRCFLVCGCGWSVRCRGVLVCWCGVVLVCSFVVVFGFFVVVVSG